MILLILYIHLQHYQLTDSTDWIKTLHKNVSVEKQSNKITDFNKTKHINCKLLQSASIIEQIIEFQNLLL